MCRQTGYHGYKIAYIHDILSEGLFSFFSKKQEKKEARSGKSLRSNGISIKNDVSWISVSVFLSLIGYKTYCLVIVFPQFTAGL